MDRLLIEEEVFNDVVVLKLDGVIDSGTSEFLEDRFGDLLSRNMVKIVVDLSGVKYISSAGWGIFIGEIKGVRKRGGDIKLANMHPDVRDVFELLEFNNLLQPFNSRDEAIADFETSKNRKF